MKPGFLLSVFASAALSMTALALPPNKVLFDATKAEMASNADWVVDADTRNVGSGSGGAMVVGAGSESNPARFPTPAQSGITAGTPETFWSGCLSAWGVELAKRGYQIETLPVGGRITFNDGTNAQDLSNYSVYIVDEPNIKFTAAEKTAILNWVAAGGGLFMIADHTGSDRNGDGFDSPAIWNDLMQTNGIAVNPFGITFNLDNISPNSTFVDTNPADPLINGPAGAVTQSLFHNGCSITISTAANPNARIAMWTSASQTSGNGMIAYSTYGLGRVVAIGDSSIVDDGTGDPNDTNLFNDWSGEAGGSNGRMAINGTIWLGSSSTCTGPGIGTPPSGLSVPNGQPAVFSVVATGTSPTYQWRLNGTPLTNDGRITGATTPMLVIGFTFMGDAGAYDVVITNGCGSVTTTPVTLGVTCYANCDQSTGDPLLTASDFACFLAAFRNGNAYANCDGSTGSPALTATDFACFLQSFRAGCP